MTKHEKIESIFGSSSNYILYLNDDPLMKWDDNDNKYLINAAGWSNNMFINIEIGNIELENVSNFTELDNNTIWKKIEECENNKNGI